MPSRPWIDDRNIDNSDGLWRHIHPKWFTWDKQASKWRPASVAFIDRSGEMSVDLASLTTINNRSLGNQNIV